MLIIKNINMKDIYEFETLLFSWLVLDLFTVRFLS